VGTPFIINGTFTADTSLFSYTATSAVTVATTTYYKLSLAPSSAGSPVYTIQAGFLRGPDPDSVAKF